MRVLLILLFFLNLLHSAIVFGDIYDADSFSKLNNTQIRIEGPTTLQFITNRNYSAELPLGNYSLTASYFTQGKLEYYVNEKVKLNQDKMRFDLVLLPAVLQNLTPREEDRKSIVQPPPQKPPQQDDNMILSILIVTVFLVVIVVIYLVYKQFSVKKIKEQEKVEGEEEIEEEIEEEHTLDEESVKILKILKSNGGRMLQKELREILKASQSNLSLVLTELEHVGYIKRFKRGRENLIKLIKGPPSS